MRNPYYQGPVSDHFDGTRFFNPGGAPPNGFRDMLRWQMSAERARWPRRLPPPRPLSDPRSRRASAMSSN